MREPNRGRVRRAARRRRRPRRLPRRGGSSRRPRCATGEAWRPTTPVARVRAAVDEGRAAADAGRLGRRRERQPALPPGPRGAGRQPPAGPADEAAAGRDAAGLPPDERGAGVPRALPRPQRPICVLLEAGERAAAADEVRSTSRDAESQTSSRPTPSLYGAGGRRPSREIAALVALLHSDTRAIATAMLDVLAPTAGRGQPVLRSPAAMPFTVCSSARLRSASASATLRRCASSSTCRWCSGSRYARAHRQRVAQHRVPGQQRRRAEQPQHLAHASSRARP